MLKTNLEQRKEKSDEKNNCSYSCFADVFMSLYGLLGR